MHIVVWYGIQSFIPSDEGAPLIKMDHMWKGE